MVSHIGGVIRGCVWRWPRLPYRWFAIGLVFSHPIWRGKSTSACPQIPLFLLANRGCRVPTCLVDISAPDGATSHPLVAAENAPFRAPAAVLLQRPLIFTRKFGNA